MKKKTNAISKIWHAYSLFHFIKSLSNSRFYNVSSNNYGARNEEIMFVYLNDIFLWKISRNAGDL